VSLLVCVLCFVSASILPAQPSTTTASIFLKASEVLQGKQFSLSRATFWRFHAGDDTTGAWAKPEFDGSAWELTSTIFFRDSLPFEKNSYPPPRSWKGVGWFRITVLLDSALRGMPLNVRIEHIGASEIFVNGKYLQSQGTVGRNSDVEKTDSVLRVTFSPDAPTFSAPQKLVIAVRYSNWKAEERFRTYRLFTVRQTDLFGFNLSIAAQSSVVVIQQKKMQSFVPEYMALLFIIGGIGILLLVNTFLYFFRRSDRTVLLYCLLLFLFLFYFIILILILIVRIFLFDYKRFKV
jgi:hypothetical protein